MDDLLLERLGRPPAVEGLAPRFILDSRELSVMLARGDAREDRALRRLVAVGHRELNRLIRAELDRHATLSPAARVMERLREAWSASVVPRLAVVAALVAFGAGGSWFAVQTWSRARAARASPTPAPVAPQPAPQPYRDLAKSYSGPGVEAVAGQRSAIDLSYRPAGEKVLFAALRLTGLNGRGEADAAGAIGDLQLYPEAPCPGGCLDIELAVVADAGLLRLPTATGHVLDAASVRANGEAVPVFVTEQGEPVLRLEAPWSGRVLYRSAPGAVDGAVREGHWPALPPEAVGLALALDNLPIEGRVQEALDFVRGRVVYDRSPAVIERYRAEGEKGVGLFSRALAVGAGDCDVQNALLAAVLSRAGVSTRLAIGWIGVGGAVLPGLHAWTEYRDEEGRWRVIDASANGPVMVEKHDASGDITSVGEAAQEAVFLSPQWRLAAYAALFLLTVVVGAVLLGRRAWQRSFQSGGESDMAELLRGAALRPQTFARVRPLFQRKVVPLLSGRAVSLEGARAERHRGRLALGSHGSLLAVRASRKGRAVLDRDRDEGRAVGEALGAVDLDWWQNLLDAARTDPLAACVEKAFQGCGEPVRVRVAADVGEAMAVLDGSPLGLGRRSRWVVVDEGSELWRALKAHADKSPNLAALILADAVAPRLGLAEDTVG
ncbi:MAG: transglutaminase-like domain-containing protein, partial [Acidobacteriota bacterium]